MCRNAGRNVDGQGHADEVLDRNEEHAIRQWRKGYLCYKVTENLAELCLCCSFLWKVELVSNEIEELAQISKQSIEGAGWSLLTDRSKM